MVGFLGQHELAGSRQGVEAGFGQGGKLELAVAVLEIGEHEERQPVVCRLVEGFEDTRLIWVAGVTLEHFVSFLAAVAAEMSMQQIDHRPQVAAFFYIHLKQVAQIVERRAGLAQSALLLDRGRLGVALGDDQAAQFGTVLTRHVGPHRFTLVLAEGDFAALFRWRQKNAPTVFRHPHMTVMGPALGIDADGGAQIDLEVAGLDRPQIVPPLQISRLPAFERAQ